MPIVMSGQKVADQLIQEIDKDLTALAKKHITPKLAIVRVGDDPGSVAYENGLKNRFKEIGLEINAFSYDSTIKEAEFLGAFDQINEDEEIHGILVLRPLPDHLDTNKVSARINPEKDVDGMSPTNLGKIMLNDEEGLISATPAAVMKILEYYEVDVEGQDVVIIGHSEVVGKPLSILLLNQNATVTITHIYSKDTQAMAKKADILITATGAVGLVTEDYVKEDAVVIDVGISRVEGEIMGDVEYEPVAKVAGKITPVPGGVGAVTTTMLASNVLKATKILINNH